jgi:hypothetical protein
MLGRKKFLMRVLATKDLNDGKFVFSSRRSVQLAESKEEAELKARLHYLKCSDMIVNRVVYLSSQDV